MLNGLLGIASRGGTRDEAAVHIVVPRNYEHTFDGTPAGLSQLLEPCEGRFIFLGVSLEGDVTANKDCANRTQGCGSGARVLDHSRRIGPIGIKIGINAIGGAKMNIGDMEYQHRGTVP